MRRIGLLRTLAGTPLFTRKQFTLSADNFGGHYVRWPYDPALNPGGSFTSSNPSRYQKEWDRAIGHLRTFDPNINGRYQGGGFVQVGTTIETTPVPFGRIEGGQWYSGMLKSDGTYDFSKAELVLREIKGKGKKVLMNVMGAIAYYDFTNGRFTEYSLPTGEFWSVDPLGYQRRMRDFAFEFLSRFGKLMEGGAIEFANEPGRDARLDIVSAATSTPTNHMQKHAVTARIWKDTIRYMKLNIKVLSPPFQGGESAEVAAFLNASAAGITVLGSDGTGKRGIDYIDVVAHHLYGNFSDRASDPTAADAAPYDSPAADGVYSGLIAFSDPYNKARSVITSAESVGWKGPYWDTESNLTGAVGTSLWTPQKQTTSGLTRTIRLHILGVILGGFDKTFHYAYDHPALGTFDNTGTPPVGEPSTWYFKARDNTASRAAAMAEVIVDLFGDLSGGLDGVQPFVSVNGRPIRLGTVASNGVFNVLPGRF